jgi:hypothetical protein
MDLFNEIWPNLNEIWPNLNPLMLLKSCVVSENEFGWERRCHLCERWLLEEKPSPTATIRTRKPGDFVGISVVASRNGEGAGVEAGSGSGWETDV